MPNLRVETIQPVLRVEDMQAALDFYVGVLGFQKAVWSTGDFAGVGRDDGSFYLSLGDQGRGGAWIWIGVDDIEPLYEELKARGVPVLMPPTNFPWAFEMRVADPDGNVLRFGSEPK